MTNRNEDLARQRVRAMLANRGQRIQRVHPRDRHNDGDWMLVDIEHNCVVETHVDVLEIERELRAA